MVLSQAPLCKPPGSLAALGDTASTRAAKVPHFATHLAGACNRDRAPRFQLRPPPRAPGRGPTFFFRRSRGYEPLSCERAKAYSPAYCRTHAAIFRPKGVLARSIPVHDLATLTFPLLPGAWEKPFCGAGKARTERFCVHFTAMRGRLGLRQWARRNPIRHSTR